MYTRMYVYMYMCAVLLPVYIYVVLDLIMILYMYVHMNMHIRVHTQHQCNSRTLPTQGPSLVDMLHRIDELDVIPQLQVSVVYT